MLAADKLLLRSSIKQRTIELREKELNLFNSNFSAVATQAALVAGFSMAFLEMSVHLHALHFNPLAKGLLHLFSTICICSNIFVVSLITFVSVWGSGKALRGKDGSMSMVVEGMNKEVRWDASTPGNSATAHSQRAPASLATRTHRSLWWRLILFSDSDSRHGCLFHPCAQRWLIFTTFGAGLLSLLCAVACST